jgi:type II secretory pathway pseudopilin PulG
MTKSIGRRYVGFTLIEMLVVAGVISFVVAITLPALQKARAMSQRVQCTSNLRTLGQAVTSYANENIGFLPPLRTSGETPGYAYLFDSPDGDYWFATLINKGYLKQAKPVLTVDGLQVNGPYIPLQPEGALACPSEKLEWVGGVVNVGWAGSHFGMNAYLSSPNAYGVSNDGQPFYLRIVQVKRPEAVCLIADGPREGRPARITGSGMAANFSAQPAVRHGKYWQAVHVDGHVSGYDSVPFTDDGLFKP